MKLKALTLLMFVLVSTCFGQFVATNRVQNTVTWYSTNSPVIIGYYAEIGVDMATNANPQAFTHSLWNFNPNNSIASLRNTSILGLPRFTIKDWAGVDVSTMGGGTGGSNIVIHSFADASSHIQLTLFSGFSANQLFVFPTVTTNTRNMVVDLRMTSLTNNSTVYQASGISGFNGSVTNLGPTLGSSNVIVYAYGLVTNQFTIP